MAHGASRDMHLLPHAALPRSAAPHLYTHQYPSVRCLACRSMFSVLSRCLSSPDLYRSIRRDHSVHGTSSLCTANRYERGQGSGPLLPLSSGYSLHYHLRAILRAFFCLACRHSAPCARLPHHAGTPPMTAPPPSTLLRAYHCTYYQHAAAAHLARRAPPQHTTPRIRASHTACRSPSPLRACAPCRRLIWYQVPLDDGHSIKLQHSTWTTDGNS